MAELDEKGSERNLRNLSNIHLIGKAKELINNFKNL